MTLDAEYLIFWVSFILSVIYTESLILSVAYVVYAELNATNKPYMFSVIMPCTAAPLKQSHLIFSKNDWTRFCELPTIFLLFIFL